MAAAGGPEQVGQGRASDDRSLVGRRAELHRLREAFAAAQAGRGDLVLVTGEAGIGKSRLLAAMGDEAESAGALVLRGSGWEGGGAPAFWPWVQALRTLAERTDTVLLGRRVGPAASHVAGLVPELAPEAGTAAAPPDTEQARFSLFDAVARLLGAAAADVPIVLLLDDLHAADHSSLLLTEFLGRTVHTQRILVLGAYREAELREAPEAAEVLARASRGGGRLTLDGLSRDELAELVRRQIGEAPAELTDRLHALTEGNPFFADELSRLLVADPAAVTAGDSLPLPESVRETLRRRLRPLPAEARQTLSVAAVVGREFALETLAAAAGRPPAEILADLDAAADAGLLETTGPGRFTFAHALVRETLYDELPRARRAVLHRAVAEAMASGPAAEAHLSELAHHFFLAAPGGGAVEAVEYAERAAERALTLLAFEQAADLFDLALRALGPRGADEVRSRLLLGRGDAEMRAGRIAAARETLGEAADIGRRLGAPGVLARAALLSAPWGLSVNFADEPLARLLEDALRAQPEDALAARARLLAAWANAVYWSTPHDERLRMVDEAIELARRSGDPPTLARVLGDSHIATWDPDSVERALPWADELLEIAADLGDRELALHGHSWRTSLLLERGDLAAVDKAISIFARLADELRQPRAVASSLRHRALRATLHGRFQEAERLLDEQAGLVAEGSIDIMLVAGQVFGLRWAQGRLAELAPAVREFAESLPAMPAWRCALLAVHRDAGSDDDLRLEYERLAAEGFDALPRDNLWLVALSLLSEACAELGDRDGAEVLERLLTPYSARMVVVPGAACLGPVSRALGLAALTRGDVERAVAHFEAAATTATRMLARPLLAHLALDRARAALAAGDQATVHRELDEARRIATDLGMPGVGARAARLRKEAASAPAVVAPGADAMAPVPDRGRALRRNGDHWTVAAGGRAFTLRDVKGLHHLARLLASPGVELHALDMAAGAPSADRRDAAPDRGDAGTVLDPAAKAAYRDRIEELEAAIEEAEQFNDVERAARAREELEVIGRELSTAVGLGGRDRRAASASERARLNVTRAIKAAIDRMDAHDPDLAAELRATVRTGTFCVYRPLRGSSPWSVEP